ncbi:MAG: DUF2294 family protein [Firmicutes bacterium]|nr:DUF2294 family protein [Bacillota bacterium]
MQSVVREFPGDPTTFSLCRDLSALQEKFTERVPQAAKVYFLDDLVVYRAQGILSKAECCLVRDDPEGAKMIRDLIEQQWRALHPLIMQSVQERIGARVLGVAVSLLPEADELVIYCPVAQSNG